MKGKEAQEEEEKRWGHGVWDLEERKKESKIEFLKNKIKFSRVTYQFVYFFT